MLCNLKHPPPSPKKHHLPCEGSVFLPAKRLRAGKCRRDESAVEKKIQPWNENGRCSFFYKWLVRRGGAKWEIQGLCKSGTMWPKKRQQPTTIAKTTGRNATKFGWKAQNLFHSSIFYFGHDNVLRKQCSCSADVSLVPKNFLYQHGKKPQTDQSQNFIKYSKLQIQNHRKNLAGNVSTGMVFRPTL